MPAGPRWNKNSVRQLRARFAAWAGANNETRFLNRENANELEKNGTQITRVAASSTHNGIGRSDHIGCDMFSSDYKSRRSLHANSLETSYEKPHNSLPAGECRPNASLI